MTKIGNFLRGHIFTFNILGGVRLGAILNIVEGLLLLMCSETLKVVLKGTYVVLGTEPGNSMQDKHPTH